MGMMHFDFMSEKLGYQTNIYVILPECMERGEKPEGILYLLHGEDGNGLDWVRNTAIERYARPYKLAVVMPEVDGSSFYTDMVHGYPYFEYVTEEVPVAMEAMLPMLRQVEKRYVAGVSAGGYAAFKWAFHKTEYFTAAANFSGLYVLPELMEDADGKAADMGYTPQEMAQIVECNWGTLADLSGSLNDPRVWADRAGESGESLPKLFAGMGTEESVYGCGIEYLSYCAKKGIEIHYEEMCAGHDWDMWDAMICRFLEWVCV